MRLYCPRCQNMFDENAAFYAFIQEPVPSYCVICRLLRKHRRTDDRRVPDPAPRPEPALPGIRPSGATRSRTVLYGAIRDWILRHDGAVPRAKDFKTDHTLPSFDAIYRVFGGLVPLFRELENLGERGLVARYHAAVITKRQVDMRTAGRASAHVRAHKRQHKPEASP